MLTVHRCGHCKALTPEYEKLAKAMKGLLCVAAVDADEHKGIAGKYGVKGFPTIKVRAALAMPLETHCEKDLINHPPLALAQLLYVDDGKIKSADYQGGRTAKEMATFMFEKAKSFAFKRMGEKASAGGAGGRASSGSAGGSGGSDSFYSGTDVLVLDDSNFSDEVGRRLLCRNVKQLPGLVLGLLWGQWSALVSVRKEVRGC